MAQVRIPAIYSRYWHGNSSIPDIFPICGIWICTCSMNIYVSYVNQKLQVRLLHEREDSIRFVDCWRKPPAYLADMLGGYGDSILSSFTAKLFSLPVKDEGEALRLEKTLAGGLNSPVVHIYQMRFMPFF